MKYDHGADDDAAVADRRGGVFDPDRLAVLAPEHLVVDLVHGAIAESRIDRAVLVRVVAAVVMGVMDDRMDVAADQFVRRPAEHALGGRIDEGGFAFGVDAVDAFAGGAQDQLVLALDVAEHALHALPGGDAAAHVVLGDGVEAALAALLEVAQRQQHQRRPVLRDQRAGIFEQELLARGVARLQRAWSTRCPSPSPPG